MPIYLEIHPFLLDLTVLNRRVTNCELSEPAFKLFFGFTSPRLTQSNKTDKPYHKKLKSSKASVAIKI
jgi:hypothetical protein